MVTLIYQDADGVYRASLSGRRIKGNPADPKKYQVVGPDVHREHRTANIRAAAARLGREPKSPAAAAGEAGKPPKPIGIRAAAKYHYDTLKEIYADTDPYDGPADMNTSRMLIKLHRHNPAFYQQFQDLRTNLNANYYKYNSVSHSIELYNHRQVYKGSYQLPIVLRSKKAVSIPQHYQRSKYREGPTTVYYSHPEGLRRTGEYVVRPPGPDIVRF